MPSQVTSICQLLDSGSVAETALGGRLPSPSEECARLLQHGHNELCSSLDGHCQLDLRNLILARLEVRQLLVDGRAIRDPLAASDTKRSELHAPSHSGYLFASTGVHSP
jgi:hypothetical protein